MSIHPNSAKNLKPFPPGVSGFAGRKHNFGKLPEELKDIKSLTQLEVNKLISKYARMMLETLKESLKNSKTPVLELAIASIFLKSIEQGDFTKLSFLLDRCIGRVPINIEDEDETDSREEISRLSMTELLTLVKTNLPAEEKAT